jgi:hypothetical protein
MFTANEMVTAIANTTVNGYMEDRHERAAFAAYLEREYGSYDETAAESLEWLRGSDIWYEDGVVSYLYRELMEFRNETANNL